MKECHAPGSIGDFCRANTDGKFCFLRSALKEETPETIGAAERFVQTAAGCLCQEELLELIADAERPPAKWTESDRVTPSP